MATASGIGLRMWQSMQSGNSVCASASQAYLSESSATADAFAAAWSNQITGTATLISKMTQKRITTELQAKLKKAQTALGVNKVA
jgi:hypothetical protein